MKSLEEDVFRLRPAAPKSRSGPRSRRFVSQVLEQVSKTGAKPGKIGTGKHANSFGRGRVAAGLAGRRLGPNARRVVIKSRFVALRRASPTSVAVHLRYIEREGVTRDGQKGQAYSADFRAVSSLIRSFSASRMLLYAVLPRASRRGAGFWSTVSSIARANLTGSPLNTNFPSAIALRIRPAGVSS